MKVLYNPTELSVIAELTNDEKFSIPSTVLVFNGTLSEFYDKNPNYLQTENENNIDSNKEYIDYKDI